MTDQEKENRAGTENEEPKAAEAAANEAAASEAVRDGEIKKLTADVEKQADEIKKLKEEVARARADYFNLRTRMERDRESNAKLAAEQAVKEMLPVFENLERIAAAINDPESGMAKGMAMVIRQFSDGLCKLGLEFIPTEGPFDPRASRSHLDGAGRRRVEGRTHHRGGQQRLQACGQGAESAAGPRRQVQRINKGNIRAAKPQSKLKNKRWNQPWEK